ncbi:trimeric intracellular cation channel family protein [Pseudohoeflea suaedae]|uniref:Trimeric intracellular cation channel family protein n=1 Tax=Pseudohoeflea suaedae TaxID=877384 RepID=A0A4R5PM57_9HYPH|nr:trimeric intracellular cation channel family protein [Pseudohoeflea suaedae]TDH38060.1 trimeric intracellular cation channel family protein [Pseudohoeflea suaedae]
MPVLEWLDYAGVAVFAATGALAASRKQLDLVGFIFLAAVTGTGGGSVRDLLLGATPVFWVEKPVYLLICAAVAILTFFTAHLVESRYKLLLWLDAAGLAAYSVMGAAKGLAISGSMTVAVVTGMLTATFGGVLRDILAGEPSVLMRPEIYVTAAGIGAAAFVAADGLGLPLLAASAIGVLAAFMVRGGALAFGWSISPYRPRPGRNPDDIV